jgi:hypothetical protein
MVASNIVGRLWIDGPSRGLPCLKHGDHGHIASEWVLAYSLSRMLTGNHL